MKRWHICGLLAATLLPFNSFALPELIVERTVALQKGENLATALQRAGLERKATYNALHPLKRKVSLRRLQQGQEITLTYNETEPYKMGQLHNIELITPNDTVATITPQENGTYKVATAKRVLTAQRKVATGTINSSLYAAASKADLPTALVTPFANLFAWELDFTRDLRPGDQFSVVYEDYYNDKGEFVRNGKIVAAHLHARGKLRQAYRAEIRPKVFAYYDEKGKSKERMLLRTPLEFTRISSHFNPHRKHPVLGYTRAHKGTDFAAPTGTPVKAAGSGRIVEIGWKGGYGKYIRIEHGNGYQTAYAHLHRYARGMRKGKRVRQGDVIAQVGSTGRSTGPHLHYEVIKNGTKVNAMRVKLPNGSPLPKKLRTEFGQQVASLQSVISQRQTIQLAQNQ